MTNAQRGLFALASALLEYPDENFYEALPDLLEEFSDPLAATENIAFSKAVQNFRAALARDGQLRAQEKYVAVFDHHPGASLYLAWHRYGNDRAQGKAMAALNGIYRTAGLEPSPGIMPDYLPHILAFFSMAEDWAIEAVLDGFGPELAALEKTLLEVGSDHAPILSAVLEPLRAQWPGYFQPRRGPDLTVRPMARPEKEDNAQMEQILRHVLMEQPTRGCPNAKD